MRVKRFSEFINEKDSIDYDVMVKELFDSLDDDNVDENAGAAAAYAHGLVSGSGGYTPEQYMTIAIFHIALVSITFIGVAVSPSISDWWKKKTDNLKAFFKNKKNKEIGEKSYQRYAEAVPEIAKAIEKHLQEYIVKLNSELESLKAEYEGYEGDKRSKEYKDLPGQIFRAQNAIKSYGKKNALKSLYINTQIIDKAKRLLPVNGKVEEDEINVLAQMMTDYFKTGKIKDTYTPNE